MHCENSALCSWLWRWRKWPQGKGLVLEAEKSKEIESSLELPERSTALKILFWTSNLHNHKIIDVCCTSVATCYCSNRMLMHPSGRGCEAGAWQTVKLLSYLGWYYHPWAPAILQSRWAPLPAECSLLPTLPASPSITSLSWAPAHCISLLSFLCPCELSPLNSHCPDSLDLAISDIIIQRVVLPAVAACVFILVPKLNWSLGLKQELCFALLLLLFLRTCTFFFFFSQSCFTTFDTKSHCPGKHL